MPDYELMYWPISGIGEPIRLTMILAGIPFKDTTPKNDENFMARKDALSPYGQLPVFLIDGKPMAQARAILRYLGKIGKYEGFPLYPEDDMEAYYADELMDLSEDVRGPIVKTFAISDQAEKEAARAQLFEEGGQIAKFLEKMDKRLAELPTRPTIGDIYAFCIVNIFRQPTFIDGVPAGVLDKYTNISKHHAFIANLPLVKEYYSGNDGRKNFQPLS